MATYMYVYVYMKREDCFKGHDTSFSDTFPVNDETTKSLTIRTVMHKIDGDGMSFKNDDFFAQKKR